MDLAAARTEFDPAVAYLNTATMGLPPRRSWAALQAALADWRSGTADAVGYDDAVEASRASYARLVRTGPETVAVGSQVSVFAGLVAANLPDGATVLTAAGDFTSVTFPFLAHDRLTVREVPLDRIVESVEGHDLVAVSAVQSADGRVLDLAALRDAADAAGAKVLLDLTQAAGWLPVRAGDFAYTVCGAYKWLLAQRGAAFLTVQPGLDLVPHHAGWYAGADRWSSIYGSPLRLADEARRFDVSPAWYSWITAAPALALLLEVGLDQIHAHDVGLTNRLLTGLGLPPSDSAIASIAARDTAAQALSAAGVAFSGRIGRLRLACHLSTTKADVDRALEALAPHLER